MVTSDPYINSMRKLPKKKLQSLATQAVQLLRPPEVHVFESSDSESNNSDCSDSYGSIL
jgi:hypothetical protein